MSGPLQFADANTKADAVDEGLLGGASAARFLPEDANYVDDDVTRRMVLLDVLPVIEGERQDRTGLTAEWESIRRMEHQQHDENQKYKGRSNAYLPVWNKNLNTITSNLTRGVFPSEDYMAVAATDQGNAPNADAIKQYLQYEFDTVARLRTSLKPFMRQLAAYGTSVLKHMYWKELRSVGAVKKFGPAELNQLTHGFENKSYCEGLRVSVRSLFNWFVYPSTAASLDEAQVVFETIDVSRDFVEAMMHKGQWSKEACAALLETGPQGDSEHDAAQQALLADVGSSAGSPGRNHPRFGAIFTVIEAWTYLKLPKKAYLPGEDTNRPLPVKLVLCNDVVLEVRRNPYYHQRPPYEVARMNVTPGFFYGSGFGKVTRFPQYLANDFANQTNDNGVYMLNPFAKVNPGMMVRPIPSMRPGAVAYCTDPNAITFDRPPVEQVQYGLQMLSTYVGMAQDFGGAPPTLQGIGGGRAGKTATQAQILQRQAVIPLQDIVEDIEVDVMVPLMRATWQNAMQYRQAPVMAAIAGLPITITPTLLAIPDAEFRWLASSQAANQQMRAQQAMAFVQTAVPLVPLLMQQGKMFDPTPVLRRIYSDALGFKDFDQVIRPLSPEEQMLLQQQQMAAAGPEGGPAANEDRVRSPTEQAAGGGEEPVADDGNDEFMAMREQADEMAAMYGGGGPAIE